ncbi:serine hydrolase [uncultured Duncaniella sp.]|uniref:serine hydrolase domain-containing protein n=1 Tax=uncultured Duncaniella sp. TaxID=2768039 RepID=UPI002648ADE0|nr:serine hydrolase [uncultured Duncaniella sp.]
MNRLIIILLILLSIEGCTTLKAIRHGSPSTDTYRNFDLDTIHGAESAQPLPESDDRYLSTAVFDGSQFHGETVGEYFGRARGNGSLLILRNDSILVEEYFGNVNRSTPVNIFSISKAITSLLCGIAIDEGYIESVADPVVKYMPELSDADPMFAKLTIEHLLDMRTGLDFKEEYGWNPFSKMAKLYYGDDVVNFISKAKFKEEPGTSHYYNSLSTAILGVVIERATGKQYAQYLEDKVWKPLGMEYDTYIALDSRKQHNAKAYGGIATTARNIAKIGSLYLNDGKYLGKQIVDTEWVNRSIHSHLGNEAYSYGWNNIITPDGDGMLITPRFFAIGLYGQVLFCDPEQNLIFVTLGEKKAYEYHIIFDDLCNLLKSRK